MSNRAWSARPTFTPADRCTRRGGACNGLAATSGNRLPSRTKTPGKLGRVIPGALLRTDQVGCANHPVIMCLLFTRGTFKGIRPIGPLDGTAVQGQRTHMLIVGHATTASFPHRHAPPLRGASRFAYPYYKSIQLSSGGYSSLCDGVGLCRRPLSLQSPGRPRPTAPRQDS